jgi:hypothetical protein
MPCEAALMVCAMASEHTWPLLAVMLAFGIMCLAIADRLTEIERKADAAARIALHQMARAP